MAASESTCVPNRIVSGGQTGADRAALDFALELGYAQGGWAPKGRMAEDGVIPVRYQLTEPPDGGMRQRTKLASAIAHDPDLLLLDEPLTGVDPVARAAIVERIRAWAQDGKTVIISSHVLYEIEALTRNIVVVYRGQVLAEGDIYAIRRLIDRHPHRIRVECDRPRELAAVLAAAEHASRLSIERGAVIVETRDPDRCYATIADVVVERGLVVDSLTSPDNNLGAVFEYLTGGHA